MLLGAVAVPAAASETRHPCAAATTRCDGVLVVPLNHAEPGSEKISVPFSWLPHSDRDRPSAGTIIALPGGPAAVMGQFNAFADTVRPLLTDYDFLMVERRGFPSWQCPQADIRDAASVRDCAALSGDRAQFFTADQRVADIEAVRAALDARNVVLYGNSYGSVEAPAYMSRFPRHVRSAVVDSPTVFPDRATGYAGGNTWQGDLDANQRAIDDACRRSLSCRALPGDTADRLAEVVAMNRRDPDIPLGALTEVVRALDPFVARDTNAAMQAYLDGDKAPLRRLVSLTGPPPGTPSDPNQGFRTGGAAALAYVCNDFAWPYARSAPIETRRAQLSEYRAQHPEHPVAAVEATRGYGVWADWCLGWPTPRHAPPVAGAYPDVPVLVIAGSFDSDAGANAVTLARQFPRGRVVNVPFAGHAVSVLRPGSTYSSCAAEGVRNFITGRPVPSCSGENFRAVGRFPVTSHDLVTTVFRTAMDSLTSRIPNSVGVARRTELPGLRGGRVVFESSKAVLDQVRYTADTVVSGGIQLTGDQATAELTANGKLVRMTWKPFEAKEVTRVTGSVDGRDFDRLLYVG
ncbi:hypothetical protein ALI144C_46980 [Actinosynnema sp. ALI-1.44]|nr:hypothetical protein ALI144C_46980 [Actinosynnema sp. ALI-1.44]